MKNNEKKYKYNAFLSYSWKDKDIADKLHADIENSVKWLNIVPRIKIFKDQKDTNYKNGLDKTIKDGLNDSEYLIILASPNLANSKSCNEEVQYWIEQKRDINNLTIILINGKIETKENVFNGLKTFSFVSASLPSQVCSAQFNADYIWVNLSDLKKSENQNSITGYYRSALVEIVAHILNTTSRKIEAKERNAILLVFSILLFFLIIVSILAVFLYTQYNKINENNVEISNKNLQLNNKNLELKNKNLALEQKNETITMQKNEILKRKNMAESQLREIQFLRIKDFRSKAEYHLQASSIASQQMAEVMIDSIKSISMRYSNDIRFINELKIIESLRVLKNRL